MARRAKPLLAPVQTMKIFFCLVHCDIYTAPFLVRSTVIFNAAGRA
jgi:hypothetical protein